MIELKLDRRSSSIGTKSMKPPKNRPEIICRCNNVSRATIEEAIKNGCHTLNEIYDATSAGVGPCGGSCRRKIAPILSDYLETGEFPKSKCGTTPNNMPSTKITESSTNSESSTESQTPSSPTSTTNESDSTQTLGRSQPKRSTSK